MNVCEDKVKMIVVELAENFNEAGYWENESDCGEVTTLNNEDVLIETNLGLYWNIFHEHGMIQEDHTGRWQCDPMSIKSKQAKRWTR